MHNPGFTEEGSYAPKTLLAGGSTPVTGGSYTILGGQGVLPAGAVMGVVTASGKLKLSASAAGDGSQTPSVILPVEVDTTGGDVVAPGWETGEFNERALTVGAGHTLASIREPLRLRGIFLRGSIKA